MTSVPPHAADAAEDACAREPIHIPGSIQPHGALLVLDSAMTVLQASENVREIFGAPLAEVLDAELSKAFPPHGAAIEQALASATLTQSGATIARRKIGEQDYDVIAHSSGKRIIVEIETRSGEGSLDTLYSNVRSFIESVRDLPSIAEITKAAAEEIRGLTGFDRVLIYQFDEGWNGTVIAEARNDALPSYLDLRFPASDIPAQARELYRLNRLRLIPDAGYTPVPITPPADPETGAPVDLSFAVLRSVSPVHLQYMGNMGTPASMSISILDDGKLWGLISCHSAGPQRVPSHVRTACDFIGQVVAMQIGAKERSLATAERVEKHRIESRLLARMAAEASFIEGLAAAPDDLLSIVNAAGAAIVWEGEVLAVGETPSKDVVNELASWLFADQTHDAVFSTSELSSIRPDLEGIADVASGVLAISVSQLYPSYILWFRPELIQTVRWGGDPRKPEEAVTGRLNPRRSFDMWKETVRHRSARWTEAQTEAAGNLRKAIVGIVMRKAEEMAALSDELRRSNKELEAFSYSISHDLRAPFRHIVGFAELLKETESIEGDARAMRYIDTIIDSAHSAGQLVDDLLGFSQLGRSRLSPVRLDMSKIVEETLRTLHVETKDRDITWKIGQLEPAMADLSFMRSVWQNLLSNALKYSQGTDPTTIEIGCRVDRDVVIYFVRDDGVGFDMAYVDKLFGVFQRLHRLEDYHGSGIGLANVKRAVERHGGRVWAEGAVGKGAVFSFALPREIEEAI